MDVCTGGELFFHLSRLKKLPEQTAKFYFAEILLGLEHLHSLNIVYRDVKPENILLDIDGHIRIADFGLSKIIPPRQRSFSFCGSPEYMSPEMLACVGHDSRLDIYCLGALLYEMLTGLPPFYSRDTHQMYEAILTEEVSLPPETPNRLVIGDLIGKMMMKDPAMRYQTLSETKRHPWLSDVDWNGLIHKQV
jgi:serum/glucocorticoid-regulated kinase 2